MGKVTYGGQKPPPKKRMPYQKSAYRKSMFRLIWLQTSMMLVDGNGDLVFAEHRGEEGGHFLGKVEVKRERLTVIARGKEADLDDICLLDGAVVYAAHEKLRDKSRAIRACLGTGKTDVLAEELGHEVRLAPMPGGDVAYATIGGRHGVLRKGRYAAEDVRRCRGINAFAVDAEGARYVAHQRREGERFCSDLYKYPAGGGEGEPLMVGLGHSIKDLAVDSRGNVYILLWDAQDFGGHLIVFVPDPERPRIVALCEVDNGVRIQLLSDKCVMVFDHNCDVTRLDLSRKVETLRAAPVSVLRGGKFAE